MQIEANRQNEYRQPADSQPCSDLDIFEMLSSVLVTFAKSQQILQCIRQVLVSDPTFTPMSLFKYLAGNSPHLTRHNLIKFLDENNLVSNQKQTDDTLKKIMSNYSINSNNGIQYTNYLNFIYPYNSGVLRDLLTNKIKKYPQIDRAHKNFRPSQSVITAFLLLIEQQIKVLKRIQIQINDVRFPNRDKLKKIIKSIKKASQKISTTVTQKSEQHISMIQLRNFIKAFIQIEDHLFLDLGRRLGLTKNGQIPIENIQNLLRKSKKFSHDKQQISENQQNEQQKNKQNYTNHCRDRAQNKYAKQMSFKEQLYKQLANTLKISEPVRNKTPRSRSVHRSRQQTQSRNRTPNKKNNGDFSRLPNNFLQIDNKGSFRNDKTIKDAYRRQSYGYPKHNLEYSNDKSQQSYKNRDKNSSNQIKVINNIFKQFIQTFLKGHKQIQKCKSKLSSISNIDFLSIFKTLDNGRGVVDAESMQKFYTKLSGIPTDYDFQLIIDRFAQPQEKWVSYSQFSDIFRCPTTKNDECNESPSKKSSSYHEINGIKLSADAIRLLTQIMYLTLDLQHHLKQIIKKLKKPEIQLLFSKINVDTDSKGFINYQQLKKYLAESLGLSIQMIDLMSLLKRLDKSKNGVVLKQQFLTV